MLARLIRNHNFISLNSPLHKSYFAHFQTLQAKLLLIVFLTFQLAGCSSDLHTQIIASDDGKFILNLLKAAQQYDGASVRPLLNSEIQKDPAMVKGMTEALKLLAANDLKLEMFFSTKDKYSASVLWSTEVKALFLRQPENTGGYIVDFVIQRDSNARVLSRIRVYEGENLSVVSFMGQFRSILTQFKLHPTFSALTLLSVMLSATGVAAALFGRDMNYRWAWVAFSLLGFGVFTTNSVAPNWGGDFLSVVWPSVMVAGYKLFAVGFYLVYSTPTNFGIAPIGLYCSLPLGAIITLCVWDDKRRARKAQ